LGSSFSSTSGAKSRPTESAYYIIFENNERGRSEGWRLWEDFEGRDWYGQPLNFETKYLGPKVDTTVAGTAATPGTLSGDSQVLPFANGEQSVPPLHKQETPISTTSPSRTGCTRAKESKEARFFRERAQPKAMVSHVELHNTFASPHLVIPDIPVRPDGIIQLAELFRTYHWKEIRADHSAYFIVFEKNLNGAMQSAMLMGEFKDKDFNGYPLTFEPRCMDWKKAAAHRKRS
jgi:hypothetical protein